jgi:hypothetical protein
MTRKKYTITEAAKYLGISLGSHRGKRESTGSRLRRLKILPQLLGLLAVASCSDPQGWTLWGHNYSVEGDALSPQSDEWGSFDTYLGLADCKKQMEARLAHVEEKGIKEGLPDYKLAIEREKQGLIITGTPIKTSKDAKTVMSTIRFFLLASRPRSKAERPADMDSLEKRHKLGGGQADAL